MLSFLLIEFWTSISEAHLIVSVEFIVLWLRVLVLCSNEVPIQQARAHGLTVALALPWQLMFRSVKILFRMGVPRGRLLVLLLQIL